MPGCFLPMSPSGHPLFDPIRRLRTHPGFSAARDFVRLSRSPQLWHLPQTWGDTALGGSLGVLDLAADLGLPSVLRRGLQAGLSPGWRTHVLAWRSRCPQCLVLLAAHASPLNPRPWADPQLQHATLHSLATAQARALRSGLDQHEPSPASADRL